MANSIILAGWRSWYKRISASNNIVAVWDKAIINHCTNLSLSGIENHKPLLQTTFYFWSDAINAFLFNQDALSPSLADVHMLTGLNISFSDNSTFLDVKPTHRLTHKGHTRLEWLCSGAQQNRDNFAQRACSLFEYMT